MTEKVLTICKKCNKERLIGVPMLRLIKRKINTGNCKSCSLKGNNRISGHTHSEETRKKMSESSKGRKKSTEHSKNISLSKIGKKVPWATGEKNWKWVKDRNLVKVSDRFLHDPLVKQWRKSVWSRDSFTCRIADNNCDGRIEAHHILSWRDYPELRYKINNGITLCHAHHPRKRAEEKRLIPTFQELVSVSN